jgi:hypothetical protein
MSAIMSRIKRWRGVRDIGPGFATDICGASSSTIPPGLFRIAID